MLISLCRPPTQGLHWALSSSLVAQLGLVSRSAQLRAAGHFASSGAHCLKAANIFHNLDASCESQAFHLCGVYAFLIKKASSSEHLLLTTQTKPGEVYRVQVGVTLNKAPYDSDYAFGSFLQD